MRQASARSEQSDSHLLHQIIRDALRNVALTSTPNDAIDLLGDTLKHLDELVTGRGHA